MSQRLFSNIRVYNHIGGLYDTTLGFWSREVRREAAAILAPREDERLLIVGIGTGMELSYLPQWIKGLGVDLSTGMLEGARRRRSELGMHNLELREMDATNLELPDGSFDAVYLPLILTVVPEGSRALAEAARVTRSGGRLVIADRFWPEDKPRPVLARAASAALGHVAMRFDHRFSEIHAGAPHLQIEDYKRVSPGDFFHLVKLRKPGERHQGEDD